LTLQILEIKRYWCVTELDLRASFDSWSAFQANIIGDMARQSFPYYPVEIESSPAFPNGYVAYRPVISISLGYDGKTVSEFYCVVDTGADYCMFPSDYLSVLGIDRDTLNTGPVHGIGEDKGVPFASVNLKVGLLGEWPVYAGFSDHWKGQNIGFLGYTGFLERFRVNLDPRNQTFQIED
jgi:hypothetical protein